MFFDNHEILVQGSTLVGIQNVTLLCKIHDELELLIIDTQAIVPGKIVRLRCPYCRMLGYLITSKAE